MKIILKKELSGLMPMPESYEDFNTIAQGKILSCEIKSPRNIRLHRKYFSLLNIVYENRQVFEDMSFDNFRSEIIRRCGYYDKYRNFIGKMEYIPKSISFSKMSQESFEILYSKSIDVILKYVLVGMKDEDLRRSVELVIGF